MTRKDFQLIADTLKASKPKSEVSQPLANWMMTVDRFADALAETNPRFDRDRFINACM